MTNISRKNRYRALCEQIVSTEWLIRSALNPSVDMTKTHSRIALAVARRRMGRVLFTARLEG